MTGENADATKLTCESANSANHDPPGINRLHSATAAVIAAAAEAALTVASLTTPNTGLKHLTENTTPTIPPPADANRATLRRFR